MRTTILTLITLLTLSLSACGGDSSSSLPACADAWKPGKTLPDPYEGCQEDGKNVEPTWFDCKDGSGRYAEYDDGTAYAREGGKVIDTAGELARICD